MPSLFARTVGATLAIAVASQTLARAGDVLVCRFTGEVVAPCACPHDAPPATPAPMLSREDPSCCELRKANPPAAPALLVAASSPVASLVWVLPARPPAFTRAPRAAPVSARQQAPPSPLYLTTRSLLL